MLGLRLASIYGLPPCALGFCGRGIKAAPHILADYLSGKKITQSKIIKAHKGFEAAYKYYQLIAKINGIANPLDYRVVEAYWLGNSLLDKANQKDLQKLVLTDFCQADLLSRQAAKKRASKIPPNAKPHHSFHVLILGSITGRVEFTTRVRDVCRIGWGEVIAKIKNQRLNIKYRPLLFKNARFCLGKPIVQQVRWYKSYLPRVKKGDIISFHWGRACQVLGKRQLKNLEKYTLLNIKAANGV